MSGSRRRLPTLLAIWGISFAAVTAAASEPEHSGVEALDLETYRTVLVATVRGEKVDYLTLRRDHLAGLERFLGGFARIDLGKLPDDDALAAGIDLYNATVLHAVAQRMRLGYRVDEREFALFKEPLIQLGSGEKISLDHLEHQILRPRFPDGLLHVGLVCGALSCPPLAAEPYLAGDVRKALERRMGEFLRDEARNRVDPKTKTLELSRLFDWFAADFGGPEGVAKYVAKYRGREVEGYRVTFREYDWALNFGPPEPPTTGARFAVFAPGFADRDGLPAEAILDLVQPWDPGVPATALIEVTLPVGPTKAGVLKRYPRSGLEVFHKL